MAPHLSRVGLHCFQRLASLGLDDLWTLVERDLESFRVTGLTDHQERVPGIAGRDAVELIETLVLRLAVGLVAEMPLAKHCGGLTGMAQHLCHGDFCCRE
jgi:hypothetical protein